MGPTVHLHRAQMFVALLGMEAAKMTCLCNKHPHSKGVKLEKDKTTRRTHTSNHSLRIYVFVCEREKVGVYRPAKVVEKMKKRRGRLGYCSGRHF